MPARSQFANRLSFEAAIVHPPAEKIRAQFPISPWPFLACRSYCVVSTVEQNFRSKKTSFDTTPSKKEAIKAALCAKTTVFFFRDSNKLGPRVGGCELAVSCEISRLVILAEHFVADVEASSLSRHSEEVSRWKMDRDWRRMKRTLFEIADLSWVLSRGFKAIYGIFLRLFKVLKTYWIKMWLIKSVLIIFIYVWKSPIQSL